MPYDTLEMAELRSQIGFVTQESVVFNDTVANNVSLWDTAAGSLARVEQALNTSLADKFVERLEDGKDTLLGDHGIKVSGGQRQRIAIAREMYKKVRLLVLDESTSALDGDSEQAILDNLDLLRGEITIVLVAHRLSTVRNADIIYVLRDGCVAEQGTHDELYQKGGFYTSLVDRSQ